MIRVTTIGMLVTSAAFAARLCSAADSLPQQALRLLEHRCLACHNDLDREGDVSLETHQQVADSGLIEPGDGSASHLLAVVSPSDGEPPAMPKDGRTTQRRRTPAAECVDRTGSPCGRMVTG